MSTQDVFGSGGRLGPPADPPTVTPDPDLGRVLADSPLDLLRAELAGERPPLEVTLDVPAREGYAVRYSTDIAYEEVKAWRKRSADKSNPSGFDELKFAGIVLAVKCLAVLRRGEEVDLDGEVLTFRHPEFLGLFGATRAADGVAAFYVRDGHVTATANRLLDEAGFGDVMPEADDDEDPSRATGRSTT